MSAYSLALTLSPNDQLSGQITTAMPGRLLNETQREREKFQASFEGILKKEHLDEIDAHDRHEISVRIYRAFRTKLKKEPFKKKNRL